MEEKANSKNKSFIGGAVILGLAGLLVKVLGAAFRIPLANIIGDDGMGYYQTSYPVYVLFLTLATAGIPAAISRMVSERYALNKPHGAYKVFRVSSLLLLITGLVCGSILFFGSGIITNAVKEPDAKYSMMALAPALVVVPLMGSYRGFFQGRQNMRPTAVSQFVEQVFRVGVGLGLAILLLDKGLPMAAAGASFGASAGGIAGLLFMLLLYSQSKKKINKELALAPAEEEESTKTILLTILTIAIPITIGSAVMPIINSIDTLIVKSRLMAIGYDSDTARSLYGQLTGMAAPIINLPQVFTQGVSTSLVPVIASAYRRNEKEFMKENIANGLRYAMIVAAPCGVGMIALAKPIMHLLYPMQPAAAESAASCLAILAVGVIFLSLVHATTGTLQGIGKQQEPVIDLCFGAAAKIAVTFFLTSVPVLNLKGAAIGTAVAYGVAAALNIYKVKFYTHTQFGVRKTFIMPMLCAVVMGGAAWGTYGIFALKFGNTISCFGSIAVGVVVYFAMVLLTRTVEKAEIKKIIKK